MLVTQSCPTLCDPVDCSLPGSSIHGIFQARVLEWGAIAFSVTVLVWGINSILYKTLCELPTFVNLSKFRQTVTDREDWHVTACGAATSQIRLSN